MNLLNVLDQIRERHELRLDARKISGYAKGGGKYAGHKYTKKKANNEENGGHGNTRLPYGIAKSEGVNTEGLTPREVWEKLKGKGYDPQEVYKGKSEGKTAEEIKKAVNEKNNPKKEKHPRKVSEYIKEKGWKESGKNEYEINRVLTEEELDELPYGTVLELGGDKGSFKKDSSGGWKAIQGSRTGYLSSQKDSAEMYDWMEEYDNGTPCKVKFGPRISKSDTREGLIPLSAYPNGMASTKKGREILETVSKSVSESKLPEKLKKIVTSLGSIRSYGSIKIVPELQYYNKVSTLAIPDVSEAKTDEERKRMMGWFLHEFTHMADGSKSLGGPNFSEPTAEEAKILNKIKDEPIREHVKASISAGTEKIRNIRKIGSEKIKKELESVGPEPKNVFDKIRWNEEKGKIIAAGLEKINKELYENGLCTISNMMDAVTQGKLQDGDKYGVTGHGSEYFRQRGGARGAMLEMMATYMELNWEGGEPLEAFKKDYPELVEILERKFDDINNAIDKRKEETEKRRQRQRERMKEKLKQWAEQ